MAPGRSMRRLLDMDLGVDAIVLIALLGYLIQAILAIVMGQGPGDGSSPFSFHVIGLLVFFGTFFMLSEMIYSIGKMAGGKGTRPQTFLTLAWHGLVMSFLWPLWPKLRVEDQAIDGADGAASMPTIPPDQVLMLLIIFAVWIWLLANYVRELHGFGNVWNVLGSLLMGMVGFSIAVAVVAVMLGAG